MSAERIPSSSTPLSPRPALSLGVERTPQTQADALSLLAQALAMLSAFLTNANSHQLIQNSDINKVFQEAEAKQLDENKKKLEELFAKLAQQETLNKWLHWLGIGYLMDAMGKIAEFFDKNLSSNLGAKTAEKVAIIVGLALIPGLGPFLALAAFSTLNPVKDLCEGISDLSKAKNHNTADIVAASINGVLGLAIAIAMIVAGIVLSSTGIGAVAGVALMGAGVAMALFDMSAAAGQTSQGVFQIQTANILKEEAPLTASLEQLQLQVKTNSTNASRIDASSKGFRQALANQIQRFGQNFIGWRETAEQLG